MGPKEMMCSAQSGSLEDPGLVISPSSPKQNQERGSRINTISTDVHPSDVRALVPGLWHEFDKQEIA